MQKFTQKYTIVCLLEDVDEGYEYTSSNWPLHTTLADTFSISKSIEDLKSVLDKISKSTTKVSIHAIHSEFFGPNNDIEVTVFEKNKGIMKLHNYILDSLKELGVEFNEPHYNGSGFKPHSTVQKHASVAPGEKVVVNNLAIVDMFPEGDPYKRRILKKTSLDEGVSA